MTDYADDRDPHIPDDDTPPDPNPEHEPDLSAAPPREETPEERAASQSRDAEEVATFPPFVIIAGKEYSVHAVRLAGVLVGYRIRQIGSEAIYEVARTWMYGCRVLVCSCPAYQFCKPVKRDAHGRRTCKHVEAMTGVVP